MVHFILGVGVYGISDPEISGEIPPSNSWSGEVCQDFVFRCFEPNARLIPGIYGPGVLAWRFPEKSGERPGMLPETIN